MSSNNRAAEFCDAVVIQHARAAGPMRLPLKNVELFIDEFNARYEGLGMSVRANEKSPATSGEDIAGDRLVG